MVALLAGLKNLPLRIVTYIDGLSLAESRVEEPSVEYFDADKLKEVCSCGDISR